MAYSDFTLERLTREFGVDFWEGELFAPARALEPSHWLTETLALAGQAGTSGQRASAERIVSPILLELARRNGFEFGIASGRALDADPARGLTGTCDFALSFTRVQLAVYAPFCCVAVRQGPDTVDELAECAALLLGAARLTQQQGHVVPAVYGCTTTGSEWRFLRLEGNSCVIYPGRYHTFPPSVLLGVLQYIVDDTRPAA